MLAEIPNHPETVNDLPIRHLRIQTVHQLSVKLNPEQPISRTHGTGDYRGIAQLMGISNENLQFVQTKEDKMVELLKYWQTQPDSTVGKFVEFLQLLERHDVIDDLGKYFYDDYHFYLQKCRAYEQPIQVPEVSSMSWDTNRLTVHDLGAEIQSFDAFLSYAKENEEYGARLGKKLEKNGFKLVNPARDLLGGFHELESKARLIRDRCRHVILILTPAFIESNECNYLLQLATSIGVETMQNKTIPLIFEIMEESKMLPLIQGRTKLDFTGRSNIDWMWDRLVATLRASSNDSFVPQARPNIHKSLPAPSNEAVALQGSSATPSLEPNTSQSPIIYFPSSSASNYSQESLPQPSTSTAVQNKSTFTSTPLSFLQSIFRRKGNQKRDGPSKDSSGYSSQTIGEELPMDDTDTLLNGSK